MTRSELINALHHVYGNLQLGNILLGFSDSIDWRLLGTMIHEVRSPQIVFKADLRPVFGTTSSLLKDQPTMVDEFQKMLRRVAVAESFEALAMYCHQSGQIDRVSGSSWYQFARILRNTASHKQGELIVWPVDLIKKGIQSVGWRHRTLDKAMEGTRLQFYDAEILALISDELEFIEKSLD